MSRFDLPVLAAMALFSGPVMFARGFRDLRTRRLIRNTPTARIRSMAMGLVEVSGAVISRSRVRAPFSGRECAYWEVDISIRMGRRGGYRSVHRNSSGNPFYVDDGTGIALVYPSGSQCRTPVACEEECFGLTLPEPYSGYLAGQRLWQRQLWRMSSIRFRERMLEEGQRVYVLGTAVPRAASRDISQPVWVEAAAAAAAEPELRATGTDGAFASFGGRPARNTSNHGPERMKELHGRTAAVIRRGEQESTFIISTESELALEISYGASTLLHLFGGPMLTIMGLGYWIHALAGRQLFH